MKRLFIILACFFLLLGCVSTKSFKRLEEKVATLEHEELMRQAADVGATMKIRGFYGLTSSDSGAGFNLAAKATAGGAATDYDLAIGRDVDGYASIYYFDSSEDEAQSLPRIVRPVDRAAADGRWVLVTRIYAQEFRSDVDDGGHMFNVSNSDDPTYLTPADWDMVVNRTEEWFGYYDVTDAEWVKFMHGKVYNDSDGGTIPYSLHWGGIVTNFGQSVGTIIYNLQQAEKDMMITFFMLVGQPISVNPAASDKFIYVGLTFADGQELDTTSAAIGHFITFRAVENGTGNYDWAVFPDNAGFWTTGSP